MADNMDTQINQNASSERDDTDPQNQEMVTCLTVARKGISADCIPKIIKKNIFANFDDQNINLRSKSQPITTKDIGFKSAPAICEPSITLKHLPSNIFQPKLTKFTNVPDEKKRQLVKILWKKDVYGTITKTSDKYAAITLLPASRKILNTNGVECVDVDEEFIEMITGNLIFVKDRSIVDENVIFSNKKCECGKFIKNEYVTFIDGNVNKIGQVHICLEINDQHCLELKICNVDIKTEQQEKNIYIHEKNAFKRDLKSITKYYEGVVIDPSYIFKIDNYECESIKVNDQVQVTLRDSGELYNGSVVWLGKVNDVAVAAVKSASQLRITNLENLMWDGKFEAKQYFDNTGYIVPLSMMKKVLPESKLTLARIKEIIEYLVKNNETETLYTDLQFIHDHLRGMSLDCIDQLLILAKTILKNLKRNYIPQKLENKSKYSKAVIENKDTVLLNCSAEVLNIICDICSESVTIVTKVYNYPPLMEILELIQKDLANSIDCLPEIKGIFADIMFVYWSIIKNGNTLSRDWILKMSSIFRVDKIDGNIKLIAALNLSFLMDSSFDYKSEVVKYLKESQKRISIEKGIQKITKNDILLGLGKIFYLCGCSTITDRNSDKVTLPNVVEKCSYAVVEFCAKVESKLTPKDYEDCIKALVIDDKSEEGFDCILKVLAKLNYKDYKEVFPSFIKKQTSINFERHHKLISEISGNDEWLKAILDNCVIKPNSYKHAVEISDYLMKDGKTANIEQILNKLNPPDSSLDLILLSFAYIAFNSYNFDIFKMSLSKCTDKNQYIRNGETLVTLIIQGHSDEDDIIRALGVGTLDVNKRNNKNKSPIMLARTKQLKKVFDFLKEKGANMNDLYERD